MTKPVSPSNSIESERYELFAPPSYHFDVERRNFFKALGAGLLIVCVMKDASALQESGGRRHNDEDSLPQAISAWLHIDENGGVTVFTGKVEVGQNIRTSLSQAVAEELHFPLEKIQVVMGDTQLVPFDMGTFGSRTTPTMNLQLRRAAAAARDALLGLAAEQWKVSAARLIAAGGKITDPQTKQSVEYAALVRGRQLQQVIPEVDPLAPASKWTVQGLSVPKVEGRDFVTGKHRYPSDQKLPGMLFGKILRPTSFGATLASVEPPGAEFMSNVTFVRDGNFIGVAAPTEKLATQAIASVRAEWKAEPLPSNKELFDYLKKNPMEGEGLEHSFHYESGSVDPALASANHRLMQTYTVAYIAHAPLEPRAAVAQWSGDNLTVWTGTQRPFGVRSELAEAFRIPEDHVRVLMPDTGSAYGGKHTGETAIEAARLARAANRPVKVVWTREEEFTWAYFRPAGVFEISSGMTKDGIITAWEYHNYNSGPSAIRTSYDIPNQRIQFQPTRSPLRQGSYRGLAATANHFARESCMDELAALAGVDPLEFRLRNLKDARFRAVLEAAAAKFAWQARSGLPRRRGYGIAGGFEKNSYVATCAEVEVNDPTGDVRVVRIVTAFDCGAVVNPDNLRNQIEGSNVMALGGGQFESIEFENGRILNPRFSRYRVPRFKDIPQMETVLIDRKDIPSAGAGETPIVGLAPAVGNAIFQAAGVRLRSMPMAPAGLKKT
ncbi:MAG TPA: molybdopterin cofactor-binding domain-containing protein [Candidatus Limnocylindrales bacterium]|nr:molybdopterin cofactor-binding domain-containing protein [Candidatus Limnocylindrales bacterium]